MILLLASCADERTLSGPCTTDCTVDVHAPGILDPASPNFHGAVLRAANWDFPLCAKCHGDDFSGGTAKVSCLGCHREGPTACTTCHAAGPTSNAHPFHAAKAVACSACHVVPARWDDGHITKPVTVTFGVLAGPARWDGETCTNVYCHGTGSPRWNAPATGACTTCHGNPPASHVRDDCASCHPRSAPHVDGIVQLGTGCNGCHGSLASNAPPNDLAGNRFTTAIGVGAHQAHLQGSARLSAPVPCATCHLVPTQLGSPGHIDTPAPAEVDLGLGWDRTAQTCASATCHGNARPVWTSTGQVFCGSCHGVPPASAPHTAAMTLTMCASCHPRTIDAAGTIIVSGGTSEHINGRVDLQ